MIKALPFALIAAATVGATEGTSKLIEQQSIGLPAMCGIIVAVVCSGRWLTNRFEDIRANQVEVKAHLEAVEAKVQARLELVESGTNSKLAALQQSIDKLPCANNDDGYKCRHPK